MKYVHSYMRKVLFLMVLVCGCGVELLPTTPGGRGFSGGVSAQERDAGSGETGGGTGGGGGTVVGAGEACDTTNDCSGTLWCSTETSTCTACGSGQLCEDNGVCLERTCSHGALGQPCRASDDCAGGITCSNSICATSPPLCPFYAVSVVSAHGIAWMCTDGSSGEPCNTATQCLSGFCDSVGVSLLCR